MELTPELIFSLIVGLPLILILGLGVTLAAGSYLLDRWVRRAAARTAEMGISPADELPAPEAERPRGPFARLRRGYAEARTAPAPSPFTQRVTAEGVVEAAPSLGLPHVKLGMWIFLASEVMFFTALIAAYITFRTRGLLDPGDVLNVPLTALNTFILIVSSLTVVLALDAIQKNDQKRFVLFLLATLVLGTVFISIQGFEWNQLFEEGITPAGDLLGTVFFVLTGFHGLHVIIGLLALVVLLLKALRGDFDERHHMGIETFGLYWHFVDIVWIVLFTIIYLI